MVHLVGVANFKAACKGSDSKLYAINPQRCMWEQGVDVLTDLVPCGDADPESEDGFTYTDALIRMSKKDVKRVVRKIIRERTKKKK